MDTLAARVGRVEAAVQHLQQEVLALRGDALAGGGRGRAPAAEDPAALAEWVRLFERELELARRTAAGWREPLSDLEARVREAEAALQEDPAVARSELEELAQIVLGGLQELRRELGGLVGAAGPPGAGTPAAGAAAALPAASALDQLRQQSAGHSRLVALETFAEDARSRLAQVERVVGADTDSPQERAGADEPGSGLAVRVRHLEGEFGTVLEPLRRHGVSLRALEETTAKVEELRGFLASAPLAGSVAKSAAAAKELEAAVHKETGSLSVIDAYRVRTGLEQVMAAVEAISRQRADDVRLTNQYLAEVYERVERDLPSDGGVSAAGALVDVRAKVADLAMRFDNFSAVQLQETEARLLHEARGASQQAAACRSRLAELQDTVARSLDRSAESQALLKSLSEQSAYRSASDAGQERAIIDVRKDLSKLRSEVSELAAAYHSGAGLEVEARLAALRADLEAHARAQAEACLSRLRAELEEEVTALREQGGFSATLQDDLERLCRDFAVVRGEASRADAEMRERVARSERELRAEIRSTQGLVLEVAEQYRGDRLGAVRAFAATLPEPGRALPPAPQPSAAVLDRAAGPEHDAGEVAAVGDDAVEWRLPGVRARARQGDGRALVSSSFTVPRFAAGPALRLKLFPLGSRRRTLPGHCSLYVTGPEGAHLEFLLRLGAEEHGPLECSFDRPEKDTGRHDFCSLEEALEADGGAVVRLTVLRAVSAEASPRAGAAGAWPDGPVF